MLDFGWNRFDERLWLARYDKINAACNILSIVCFYILMPCFVMKNTIQLQSRWYGKDYYTINIFNIIASKYLLKMEGSHVDSAQEKQNGTKI